MKNFPLLVLSFLCVVAIVLFFCREDIHKTQKDFQAYSRHSLLPEDFESIGRAK